MLSRLLPTETPNRKIMIMGIGSISTQLSFTCVIHAKSSLCYVMSEIIAAFVPSIAIEKPYSTYGEGQKPYKIFISTYLCCQINMYHCKTNTVTVVSGCDTCSCQSFSELTASSLVPRLTLCFRTRERRGAWYLKSHDKR